MLQGKNNVFNFFSEENEFAHRFICLHVVKHFMCPSDVRLANIMQ